MSDKQEELSSLLKNIQKGLKSYGIKDLNDALASLLAKKNPKNKEIEVVLRCVCQEYSIGMKDLLKSSSRGAIQEARKMSVCLLHLNTGLTVRFISQRVFEKDWHTFVANAIKRHKSLNETIKPDREYKERYDRIEQAIKNKLNK